MKSFNIEEFDNIIKKKFENFEESPPAEVFTKIKKTIYLKKLIRYFSLSSFVLFLSTLVVFKIGNHNVDLIPLKVEDKALLPEFVFLSIIPEDVSIKNQNTYLKVREKSSIESNIKDINEDKNYVNEIIQATFKDEDHNKIYNYQIHIKPSVCKNKNGAIYINCDNCDDLEFVFNDEVIKGKKENIASGFYKIYVRKGTRLIDTISVFVKDSIKVKPDFNIFELFADNLLTVYLENTTTVDHKPWTVYDNCNFTWFINNQKISTENNVIYQFAHSDNYNIKLVCNYQNLCIDSILRSYIVNVPANIESIQNIFTPNNDGINDYFEPQLIGFKVEECSIFDRNGILVYSVKNKEIRWDGKILNSNTLAPEGVYYYVIKAISAENKNIDIKGMLYLRR